MIRRRVVVPNDIIFESIEECIAQGEVVTLLTKGQSMQPFIRGGRDSIELSAVSPNELKIGDILLAKLPATSQYVVHRAINITPECITLMGDGNIKGCEKCHPSNVIARVTAIVKPHKRIDPYSKKMLKLAKTWKLLLPIRRGILAVMRRTIF